MSCFHLMKLSVTLLWFLCVTAPSLRLWLVVTSVRLLAPEYFFLWHFWDKLFSLHPGFLLTSDPWKHTRTHRWLSEWNTQDCETLKTFIVPNHFPPAFEQHLKPGLCWTRSHGRSMFLKTKIHVFSSSEGLVNSPRGLHQIWFVFLLCTKWFRRKINIVNKMSEVSRSWNKQVYCYGCYCK